MRSIIADTNVFLRFLLNDIPQQVKVIEKVFIRAKNGKVTIIVPQIVVFEIEFILRKYYLFKKQKVLEKIKLIVSIDYLKVESKEIFIEALNLYSKHSLSFVDCFLIARAKIDKTQILTFDQKVKKLMVTTSV